MVQKKTRKRELSYDEKSGHHYRSAKRTQEEKLERRSRRLERYIPYQTKDDIDLFEDDTY